jgi:hypothetical protein
MIRAQILFTPETYEKLKRAAAAQHKGRSALVREIVERALATAPRNGKHPRRYGFTFIGTFKDKARDVAERHDHYLDERRRW